MFKSKKPKSNQVDLEDFVRKQKVRKAAQMSKIRGEILVGIMAMQ